MRGEVQNLSRSGAGHTYFSLVEKAGRGDRAQGRLDVALFRDDRRAVAPRPGRGARRRARQRRRGAHPRPGHRLPAEWPLPAGDDRRSTRCSPSAGSPPTGSGCSGPSAPRACSTPTPARGCPRCRCGSASITSAGSAAYHDFVHELELSGYAWQVAVADVRVQGAAAARRIKWALRAAVAARRRRGRARPRRRVPRRSRAVRHRARGARDRGDAGAGHHRRRARDRSQRGRRGRAHRVQDPDRVRAAADAAGSTSSWHASTTPPTGWRHGRVADGPRRAGARRRVDAPRASARPAAASREQARARARPRAARRAGPATRRRRRGPSRRLHPPRRRAGSAGDAGQRPGARRPRAGAGHAALHHLDRATLRLDGSEAVVRALDPRRVLERGYTITRDADGRVVRRADGARRPVRVLETELAEGRVTSRVEGDHGGRR